MFLAYTSISLLAFLFSSSLSSMYFTSYCPVEVRHDVSAEMGLLFTLCDERSLTNDRRGS